MSSCAFIDTALNRRPGRARCVRKNRRDQGLSALLAQLHKRAEEAKATHPGGKQSFTTSLIAGPVWLRPVEPHFFRWDTRHPPASTRTLPTRRGGERAARLFVQKGGRFVHGDARSLMVEPGAYAVDTEGGRARRGRGGGGARALVRRRVQAAGLRHPHGGEARLPHALQAPGQRRAQPSGVRHGRRLRPRADDPGRAHDHRRRVRRPGRAADAGTGRPRRAAGPRDLFRSAPAPTRRRGWARGPACPTCAR